MDKERERERDGTFECRDFIKEFNDFFRRNSLKLSRPAEIILIHPKERDRERERDEMI